MPVGCACIIVHLLDGLWFIFCRTSNFSKVLSQYCRVVKTYKSIWLYRTRNDMYVDHTPKLFRKLKSRNKVLNEKNPSCETTQKQQLWFQPRMLIYCKESFAFLVSKTSSSKHMTIENINAFYLHTFFVQVCWAFFKYWISEFRLCMLYVKTHRLSHSNAHVTIFLTDNANVCCNSRTGTNKCKKKQHFSIAHISLTILQMFLVFMMIVNVV